MNEHWYGTAQDRQTVIATDNQGVDVSEYLQASEARNIAGPNLSEWVKTACSYIRGAAEEKQREILLNRFVLSPAGTDFWVGSGYYQHPDWLLVKKTLEDLGYHVDYVFRDEKSAGTLIRW